MKKKYLFLDIDGVLDSQRNLWNEKRPPKKGMENILDWRNLFWVGLFCRITKIRIILSSSWRGLWDENLKPTPEVIKADKRLKKWGIKILDKTALGMAELKKKHSFTEKMVGPLISKCNIAYFRGTQILEYIERNNINTKDILIFDDDVSDIICYDELKPRVIQSYFYKTGFGFKQFKKAIKLWRKK